MWVGNLTRYVVESRWDDSHVIDLGEPYYHIIGWSAVDHHEICRQLFLLFVYFAAVPDEWCDFPGSGHLFPILSRCRLLGKWRLWSFCCPLVSYSPKKFTTMRDTTRVLWWEAKTFSCSFAVKLILTVPKRTHFVFPVSWSLLALLVLFLAVTCVMPLISESPDIMSITILCQGSEAGVVLTSWLFSSIFWRMFLALSKRNFRRYYFFNS